MGSGIRPKCPKGELHRQEKVAGAYTATLIVTVIIANNGVDLRTGGCLLESRCTPPLRSRQTRNQGMRSAFIGTNPEGSFRRMTAPQKLLIDRYAELFKTSDLRITFAIRTTAKAHTLHTQSASSREPMSSHSCCPVRPTLLPALSATSRPYGCGCPPA